MDLGLVSSGLDNAIRYPSSSCLSTLLSLVGSFLPLLHIVPSIISSLRSNSKKSKRFYLGISYKIEKSFPKAPQQIPLHVSVARRASRAHSHLHLNKIHPWDEGGTELSLKDKIRVLGVRSRPSLCATKLLFVFLMLLVKLKRHQAA